jgi:hypothetical protein
LRLLLDTNVLLLWFVGSVKPEAIGGKRLGRFTQDDFDLVEQIAAQSSRHVTTAHILTETSNFLGSGQQQLVHGATDLFSRYVGAVDEIFIPARDVGNSVEFRALGLTDAAILHFAQSDVRVVSVDNHLCNRLSQKGVDVVNPWHFRTPC